jgi:hypothetical protein
MDLRLKQALIEQSIAQPVCAICTSTSGPFTREPLGRNNAPVNVCHECSTLDARHYSFDDSAKCKGQTTDSSRRRKAAPRG